MKICYFAPPASVHARRWLEYMHARGHEIHVVTVGPRRDNWPRNWPIHLFPPPFPGAVPSMGWRVANWARGRSLVPSVLWLVGVAKVRRLLGELRPDLVHVHYVDDLSICALLSGFHPTVATPWGSDLLIDPKRYTPSQLWLFRRALSSTDLMTFNSSALRQVALRFGARPDRTCMRQWGIDLQQFQPRQDTDGFREKWNLKPDSLVILSPRTTRRPLYCIEGVLRAFRVVSERHPEAILIQFDATSNPEAHAQLKRVAAELGIESRVRWLGFVPEHELPLAYSLAKITVSLATSDSLPMSLLEAMACGSLPVFNNVGGMSDWITPGHNGMLVRPGDWSALAAAVLQVLNEPAGWWESARARNLEIIRSRANRARELERVEQDYLALASHHPPQRDRRTAAKDEGVVA